MPFRIRKRVSTLDDFLNSLTDLNESLIERNKSSIMLALKYFISLIDCLKKGIDEGYESLFEQALGCRAGKVEYTIGIVIESKDELRLLMNSFDTEEFEERKYDSQFSGALDHFYGRYIMKEALSAESIDEAISIVASADKKGSMRFFFPLSPVGENDYLLQAILKYERQKGAGYTPNSLPKGDKFSMS
ncbi:MAG TPA: hypothetical protein ENN46_01700 [Candidatus Woesearchaeota archaeon]|nr:hypothetical protein [Candidatus Woesearchaeota archaeon]